MADEETAPPILAGRIYTPSEFSLRLDALLPEIDRRMFGFVIGRTLAQVQGYEDGSIACPPHVDALLEVIEKRVVRYRKAVQARDKRLITPL